MILRPSWRAIVLAFVLFGCCVFLQSFPLTATNVGYWAALPQRIAEAVFGDVRDASTPGGAIATTGYHALNFAFYYLVAALLLRQRRREGSGPAS
jgi:hypothetical protein